MFVQSSAIIEHLKRLSVTESACVVYFYVDFRDQVKKSIRGLVSSLLAQLATQSEPYHDILSCLHLKYAGSGRRCEDYALRKCLKDMLTLPGQPPVYIILDALDECPDSGMLSPRETVLGFIKELVDLQLHNLRICAASRPEVYINADLERPSFRHVSLDTRKEHANDIAIYIRSICESDSMMKHWEYDARERVVDTLIRKNNGM
jgi:hypothetical protein